MTRRLIIDTNLLLLLIIGAVEGGKHIKNSNRLNKFSISDFDKITKIISEYDEIHITPYIATEISNLIDLTGDARLLAFQIAQEFFCNIAKTINIELGNDCSSEFFLEFGLTDSSLIKLAPNFSILTCDYKLLGPLYSSSKETIIPYPIGNY